MEFHNALGNLLRVKGIVAVDPFVAVWATSGYAHPTLRCKRGRYAASTNDAQ